MHPHTQLTRAGIKLSSYPFVIWVFALVRRNPPRIPSGSLTCACPGYSVLIRADVFQGQRPLQRDAKRSVVCGLIRWQPFRALLCDKPALPRAGP